MFLCRVGIAFLCSCFTLSVRDVRASGPLPMPTARLSRVSCRVLALLYFVKWFGARGALRMWSSGVCSDLQRTAVAASVDPLCGNKTFLALDCLDWWPL